MFVNTGGGRKKELESTTHKSPLISGTVLISPPALTVVPCGKCRGNAAKLFPSLGGSATTGTFHAPPGETYFCPAFALQTEIFSNRWQSHHLSLQSLVCRADKLRAAEQQLCTALHSLLCHVHPTDCGSVCLFCCNSVVSHHFSFCKTVCIDLAALINKTVKMSISSSQR